jgi:hypothetical protein
MNNIGAILLILTFSTTQLSFGQSTESKHNEKVASVIQELFDGYRAGDSTRVRAVFTADAYAQTILSTTEGETKLSTLASIDNFIKYIGGGFEEVHDEKLWDMQIHTDERLATVWTKYAFFLDENFIHCGTETFLLRKVKSDWKVFYLVDTRQKTGCKLPAEIKK